MTESLPKPNKHLTNCPACDNNISRKAPFCPHCGHPSKNLVKVDLITVDAIAGMGCAIVIAPIFAGIIYLIGLAILMAIGASWSDIPLSPK